jgi:hypothetical protein
MYAGRERLLADIARTLLMLEAGTTRLRLNGNRLTVVGAGLTPSRLTRSLSLDTARIKTSGLCSETERERAGHTDEAPRGSQEDQLFKRQDKTPDKACCCPDHCCLEAVKTAVQSE